MTRSNIVTCIVHPPAPGVLRFVPHIVQANDYYSFGSIMPGRSVNSGGYRYRFYGQERDDEIKGIGNSFSFDFRLCHIRVGRFLSVDPYIIEEQKFPFYIPCQFAGNKPIQFTDLLGTQEGLPWYLGSNSYDLKPGGTENMPVNIIGELWNSVDATYYESIKGKPGSSMILEANKSTDELSEQVTNGDIEKATLESTATLLPTRRTSFSVAKRKPDIPMSEHPVKVIKPKTAEGNLVLPKPLDSRNRKLYNFSNERVIREDFPDNTTGQKQDFTYGDKDQKLKGHSPEGSHLPGGGFDPE